MTAQKTLTANRFKDRYCALGIAVSYLMTKPAFARLGFGHWSRVLTGQINRDHYFFIFDGSEVVGFAGWALADTSEAEAWLAGRPAPSRENRTKRTIVILNAWAAETPAANRRLLEEMRRVGAGMDAIYARREYADGSSRPVKMRIRGALAMHAQSSSSASGSQAA
jgi:hemolysin-activating ACP:hemolysin acyltransferase